MNAFHTPGGSRFPGLLFAGVVAGAIGLALSAGDPSQSSTSRNANTGLGSASGGSSGQYGLPSSDTGMSASAAGPSSSGPAGTAGPSSSGNYGSGDMQGTASLPPNVSPGWKIRVCSEKTKADQINFKVTPAGSKASKGASGTGATGNAGATGMGGTGAGEQAPDNAAGASASANAAAAANPANDPAVNAALSDNTASWTRGEASEINLPVGLMNADRIRIEATPAQKDKKASVCVIYNDHVAKKLSFDDREVSTVKSTDNGECGC